jgi:hypothetical protein
VKANKTGCVEFTYADGYTVSQAFELVPATPKNKNKH